MNTPLPINIIHSPETEPVTPDHEVTFQAALKLIQPILQQAGFEQFLLTVHQPDVDPDGLGMYRGAIGGVNDAADVGGLLMHANQISGQYLRHLKR